MQAAHNNACCAALLGRYLSLMLGACTYLKAVVCCLDWSVVRMQIEAVGVQ